MAQIVQLRAGARSVGGIEFAGVSKVSRGIAREYSRAKGSQQGERKDARQTKKGTKHYSLHAISGAAERDCTEMAVDLL